MLLSRRLLSRPIVRRTLNFNQQRLFGMIDLPVSRKSSDKPLTEEGYPLLYEGSQQFSVRLMFGMGTFNTVYWTVSYLTADSLPPDSTFWDYFSFSSPFWLSVGLICTGGILFFTKIYSFRNIYRCYENPETGRLGLITFTFYGSPGKRYEIYPINMKALRVIKETSLIPMSVKGIDRALYLDKDGVYYDNGRLLDIVNASTMSSIDPNMDLQNNLIIDKKEDRMKKLKEQYSKNK